MSALDRARTTRSVDADNRLGGWIARPAPATARDAAPALAPACRDELCRSAGFTVPDRHE